MIAYFYRQHNERPRGTQVGPCKKVLPSLTSEKINERRRPQMTNDEPRMTKERRMPKHEYPHKATTRLSFGIHIPGLQAPKPKTAPASRGARDSLRCIAFESGLFRFVS